MKKGYLTISGALAAAIFIFSAESAFAKPLPILQAVPGNFSAPADNQWLPMSIGDTYVYIAEEDEEIITNEITNTGGIKTIMGIDCYVIHDVEWVYIEDLNMSYVLEETEDWYAWDNDGNVWYFGEDTVEYVYDDDWTLIETSTEGSWEAGVDGALPGILMLASPTNGVSYYQEFYEDEAEDQAKVLRLNAMVEVEYGEFSGCLVTKEWTNLSPGEIEHKYYASGVGLVFIEELKEKSVYVELVEIY